MKIRKAKKTVDIIFIVCILWAMVDKFQKGDRVISSSIGCAGLFTMAGTVQGTVNKANGNDPWLSNAIYTVQGDDNISRELSGRQLIHISDARLTA